MPYDSTGTYTPEEMIARKYKMADMLRDVPAATGPLGALAEGLGGLGGGYVSSKADAMLKANQGLMASTLKNAGATTDPMQQRQIMTQSGIPSVQEAGLKIEDPNAPYRLRAQQAEANGLTKGSPEWRSFVLTGKLPGDDFGKAGTVVQGNDGKFYSVQFGANGSKKVEPLEFSNGAAAPPTPLQPAKGVEVVGDTVISKATGADIRNVAPALSGGERAKEVGQQQGKNAVNLPSVEAGADRMVRTIDALTNDPDLKNVTGWVGGRLPESMQSPGMAKAQSKINEVLGGTFLQAYNDLRGGGQISDAEGKSAKAAYARLQTQTMDTGEYQKALKEFRTEILRLTDIARVKAGQQPRFFKPQDITSYIDKAAKEETGQPNVPAGARPTVPPGWQIETVPSPAPAVNQ